MPCNRTTSAITSPAVRIAISRIAGVRQFEILHLFDACICTIHEVFKGLAARFESRKNAGRYLQ